MPPLVTCVESDDECALYALGDTIGAVLKCVNSVCMVMSASGLHPATPLQKPLECTQHKDCPEDLLCSGEGLCVLPVIEIVNEFEGGSMDLSLYSESCDESSMDTVDLYG